ncbi:MAG: TrmH family RNA methyltransferase [Pirellula sp.]
MVQRIQSLSSPQLRRLKRLHRVETGQSEFLIEGTHLLSEALATGWPLSSVYYTEKWEARNRELFASLSNKKVESYVVELPWLKQAVTTQNPDGVVAIGRLGDEGQSGALGGMSGDPEDWSLVLATEGVQDPGNAGTLLRSVVGLGGSRMYLSPDSVSPVHPKFLRSTAGQWFRCPPVVVGIDKLTGHARSIGAKVVVADMDGQPVWDLDLRQPTVIVLGAEGRGVSSRTRQMADSICLIPMVAGVESLNVAIVGTILLYEARRQRLGL